MDTETIVEARTLALQYAFDLHKGRFVAPQVILADAQSFFKFLTNTSLLS